MADRDVNQILESIRVLASDLVQHVTGIRISSADDRGWIVVPVESGSHFDQGDAENLTNAFGSVGSDQVFAIPTESLMGEPASRRIDATVSGLQEFSHECGHFNYFLAPDNASFAVLCTVDDYYLISGPTKIVRIALGKDVSEAWEDFEKFTNDPGLSTEGRANLASIIDFYQPA